MNLTILEEQVFIHRIRWPLASKGFWSKNLFFSKKKNDHFERSTRPILKREFISKNFILFEKMDLIILEERVSIQKPYIFRKIIIFIYEKLKFYCVVNFLYENWLISHYYWISLKRLNNSIKVYNDLFLESLINFQTSMSIIINDDTIKITIKY